MDGLVASGFVVLGGPLADEERVVLAIDAPSEDDVRTTLAVDPWHGSHLLVDSVDAWTIRLDGRIGQGRNCRARDAAGPARWPPGSPVRSTRRS